MTEKKRHFDEDLEGPRGAGKHLGVSPQFSADLNDLFKPELSVPPEVDRLVCDRANRHFVRRGRRRRLLRWVGSMAAVAAVIVFAFVLDLTKEPAPTLSRSALTAIRADIDQNGRVDILDAFKLARHVESAEHTEKKWDINGDGLVNRNDVDSIAFAAVSLSLEKQGPG